MGDKDTRGCQIQRHSCNKHQPCCSSNNNTNNNNNNAWGAMSGSAWGTKTPVAVRSNAIPATNTSLAIRLTHDTSLTAFCNTSLAIRLTYGTSLPAGRNTSLAIRLTHSSLTACGKKQLAWQMNFRTMTSAGIRFVAIPAMNVTLHTRMHRVSCDEQPAGAGAGAGAAGAGAAGAGTVGAGAA